jgi:hypothetical protein
MTWVRYVGPRAETISRHCCSDTKSVVMSKMIPPPAPPAHPAAPAPPAPP